MTLFADALFERLEPYAHVDEENGGPLRAICDAIGAQFRDVDLIVADSDDGVAGWARLWDLEETAELRPWALSWVAQFAGGRIPEGMTADDAVVFIREVAGHRRGTVAALRGAVQQHLTDTKTVRILERDTSAYHLTVVTRTSETPDPAAAEAAARAQKPAGLVLAFLTSDVPLIDEGTDTIDSASATIDSATLADVT